MCVCQSAPRWKFNESCNPSAVNQDLDGKLCHSYSNPKHPTVQLDEFLNFLPENSVIVFFGDSIIRGLFTEALSFFKEGEWYESLNKHLGHIEGKYGFSHSYLCPKTLIHMKNVTIAFLWNPDPASRSFYTSRPWESKCAGSCGFRTRNISRCDGSDPKTVDIRWQCGDAVDDVYPSWMVPENPLTPPPKRKFYVISGSGVHSVVNGQYSRFASLRHPTNMSDPVSVGKLDSLMKVWSGNVKQYSSCWSRNRHSDNNTTAGVLHKPPL